MIKKSNHNFYKLFAIIHHYRRILRILFAIIFIISIIYLINNFAINTDFQQFLDNEHLSHILTEDELFIIFHTNDEENIGKLSEIQASIEEELKINDYVYSVNYHKETNIDIIESFFIEHFYLFLNKDKAKEISHSLSKREKIIERLDAFYSQFGSFGSPVFFTDDILNIYNEIIENINLDSFFTHEISPSSKDNKKLLSIIKTVFPPQDTQTNKEFLEYLRQLIKTQGKDMDIDIFETFHYNADDKDIDYGFLLAGGHLFSYYDSTIIRKDIIISMTITSLFLLILFYTYFRNLKSIFALITLLSFGLTITYTIAILLFGPINIFVAAFSAVLIALGIDYLIHLYSTMLNYKGKDTSLRLVKTYKMAFSGIVFGSLTTAISFFSLYIISFPLIQQLAIIIGIGIILMFLIIIFLFPLFAPDEKMASNYSLHFTLYEKIMRNKKFIFFFISGIIAFMIIYIGYNINDLRFCSNFQNLRPREDIPSNNLAYTYANFEAGSNTVYTYINENDPAKIISLFTQLSKYSDKYGFQFFDISFIFQNNGNYSKIRDTLGDIDFDQLYSIILENNHKYGLSESYIEEYLNKLKTSINTGPDNYVDLRREPHFNTLFDRVLIWDNDEINLILMPLFFHDESSLEDFMKADIHSSINIIDTSIMIKEIEDIVKTSFPKAIILAVSAAFLITFIKFRNINALLSLFPTIFSIITTVFFMLIMKIDFNYSSIIVLPIIFGIGIDDGIHFLHRYHITSNIKKTFSNIFFPISITSLTTIIGFGSLVFSSYTGFFQIGLLCVIGILSALIYTVFFLPVILHFLKKSKH